MTAETIAPIIIFEDADKAVEVRLDADRETVWLTQRQMADVFDTSTDNIGLHLKNIYADDELGEEATTEESSVLRQEGQRQVRRRVKHYNLDAIISVGYRVNSGRAVKFRQWATRVLREHLTRGWTLNRQRLEENARELEAALALVRKASQSPALDASSGRGLVDMVSHDAQIFLLLQRYDEGLLTEPRAQAGGNLPTLEQARAALDGLKSELMVRGEATDLFARTGVMAWIRCWAISIRACLVSPPTPASSPRARTCSISWSRTTRFPMATSAAPPICLWTSSTAMAAC